MPYCTISDLTTRYSAQELIDLSDRADPPVGAIDTAVLDAAIAEAGAVIDSYLGGRYTLPLATTPPALTAAACHLTRYALYDDRAPERVRELRDEAVAWLRDLAAGRAVLPDVAVDGGGAGLVEISVGRQAFRPAR